MSNNETQSKQPDFNIFVTTGTGDKKYTHKIGAAWKHGTGDGMNITLFALPVTGSAVAFPNLPNDSKEKAT